MIEFSARDFAAFLREHTLPLRRELETLRVSRNDAEAENKRLKVSLQTAELALLEKVEAETERLREQLRDSEGERATLCDAIECHATTIQGLKGSIKGLREAIEDQKAIITRQRLTIEDQKQQLEKVDQTLAAVGAEEMGPNRVGSIEWLASAWNSAEAEEKRLRVLTEGYKTTVEDQQATIARLRNVIEDQKQHMMDPDGVQVGGPIDLEGGELLVWDGLHGEPEFATPETGFDPEEKLVIYIIRNHRVVWRRPDAVEEG